MDKETILKMLNTHKGVDNKERDDIARTIEFIKDNEDFYSQKNEKGHLTASAWVVDIMLSKTLLTHHKKLNRWLQMGGHIEKDKSLAAAALREAREESGIVDLELFLENIFDVDVHLIPERKGELAHYHYDIRFLLIANKQDFKVGDESHDLEWFKFDKAKTIVNEPSIKRMIIKTEDLIL